MREKILQLRSEGKTYKQIREILNCSKSTISYYCGEGQKEKTKNRTKLIRKNNPILQKLDNFKSRKINETDFILSEDREKRYFVDMVRKFQKRDGRKIDKDINTTFTWKDIVSIYGENTNCYLTGEPINLYKTEYHFDHITPVSKGGDNSFDNLGIAHKIANQMKSDLSVDELIEWCVKILNHNGYNIIKK